jgi:hypothetical protein
MAGLPGLEENYQRWATMTCINTEGLNLLTNSITISGLRVTFDIKKGPKLKTNKATIKVYNLSPNSRGFVQLPIDDMRLPTLQIQLNVGYGEEEKIVFLGRATAVSNWEAPNWVTTFTATDGDVQFDLFQYEKKFKAGTPVSVIVNDLLSQSGLELGKISPITGNLEKPRTFSGPPLRILQNLQSTYGFAFDVQDQNVRVVPGGATALTTSIIKVDLSSGLVGQPRVKDNLVIIDMLINPDVKPGTLIQLISTEILTLSGVYLVLKMSLKGDNWGSSWLANLEMQSLDKHEIFSITATPITLGGIA